MTAAHPSTGVHQLTTVVPEVSAAPVVAVEREPQKQPAVAATESAVKKAAPQDRPAVRAETLTVEVSNGAGRNKLAARVRGYLESKGLNVSFLTNAASFDNKRTTVFYKKGQRRAADKFAKQLPVAVDLIESNDHYADIRIRLGADILEFDKKVLYAGAMGERNV